MADFDDRARGKKAMESAPPLINKIKRNEIFAAIKAAGLDPNEFALERGGAEVRIEHKRSESHFIIGGKPGHYAGRYVTGDWDDWPYNVYSWEAVMERVGNWLTSVNLDLKTPDLWADLRNEVKLLGPAFDGGAENRPFTKQEQNEIATRLQELAEYARQTNALSERQMQVLETKLGYLVSVAGRVGQVDWRSIFIGVIVEYLLNVALPPESTRQIFGAFLRGVADFFPMLPQ